MAFIELDSISLDFPIYSDSKKNIKKEFIRSAIGGIIKRKNKNTIIKALSNISLTIKNGNKVGVIGHNGSGKTSLLRLMAGIYEPSCGHITTQGRITSVFDIMLGINEESTGFENILLRGVLQGMTLKEIEEKRQEIICFTELGDYIHMPVRTYSSGMRLRLAFGIATSVVSNILIIDEVIGVGDLSFIKKARERITRMITSSNILILSSHSIEVIEKFCNRLLWLDAGKVNFYGGIKEGIAIYKSNIKL